MAEKIEQRSVSVRIDGKEVENSLKKISSEVTRLRNETYKLSEGTDAYVRKALALAQASEAAKENRDSVKLIAEAWKSMPADVRESITKIQADLSKLREDYGKLMEAGENVRSPKMMELKAQIHQLQNEIVQTTQKFVELQKPAVNSITAIEKELAQVKIEMERAGEKSDLYREKMARWKELNGILEEHRKELKSIEHAAGSLNKMEAELEQLMQKWKAAEKGSVEYNRTVRKINALEKEISEHKKDVKSIEGAWYKNIPAMKAAMAAAAGLFAIDAVVTYTRELYKTGVEMDNIARKSAVVLKEQLGLVNNEAKENAKDIGLAREQYVGLATDVTAFLQSQKFSRAEAAKMSTEVVNLSGVLAQFQGGGIEKTHEALEAIKGAFAEDVEQLAKFNIAISENVVQAKMQELGLQNANAAVQQHGRGMIILKMIMEGAKAQNEAFAGSADGMVRSQARVDAMLQTITNNLSRFFIPVFEKMLAVVTPTVEFFTDLSAEAEDFIPRSERVAQSLEKERGELGTLVNRIVDHNTKADERKGLMDELQIRYPDFLKNLNKEKVTNEQLTQRLQAVNNAYLAKITLIQTSIDIEKSQHLQEKSAERLSTKRIADAQDLANAQDYLKDKTLDNAGALKKLNEQLYKHGPLSSERMKISILISKLISKTTEAEKEYYDQQEANINKAKENQKRVLENLKKAHPELAKEFDKLLNPPKTSDIVDMSGDSLKAQQDRKKREEEIKKHLEKLREALKSHRSDMLEQEMRDDERDEARIKEKYRKDIELAQELTNQKGKVGEEAKQILLDLEQTQQDEINAKKKENAEKIIQDLKKISSKYALEESDLALDELGKKLKAIKDKYKDEFEKVAKAGESKDPSVKAQAETTRVDLEKAMNLELETERDRHLLEMAKKQEDAWQKTQIATATEEDAEVLKVIFHYQDLIDLNVSNHDTVLGLIKAQEEEINKVRSKYRENRVSKEKETADKIQKGQEQLALAQAKIEEGRFKNYNAFGELVGAVLGETAKKSLAYMIFQKGLAAAEVIMNANREAAAIRVAYAQQALAVSSLGIPGMVLASGLRIAGEVLARQAVVRGYINAGIVVAQGVAEYRAQQKYDGGHVQVTGAQDGKNYDALVGGEAKTGMVRKPTLFLTGEGNKAEYVIANPELAHPAVANFLPVVEAIRQRRVRGYENGGDVESYKSPNVSNFSNIPLSGGIDQRGVDLLQKIYDALVGGKVVALVTTEGAFELQRLQNRAVGQAGYDPQ